MKITITTLLVGILLTAFIIFDQAFIDQNFICKNYIRKEEKNLNRTVIFQIEKIFYQRPDFKLKNEIFNL